MCAHIYGKITWYNPRHNLGMIKKLFVEPLLRKKGHDKLCTLQSCTIGDSYTVILTKNHINTLQPPYNAHSGSQAKRAL